MLFRFTVVVWGWVFFMRLCVGFFFVKGGVSYSVPFAFLVV